MDFIYNLNEENVKDRQANDEINYLYSKLWRCQWLY